MSFLLAYPPPAQQGDGQHTAAGAQHAVDKANGQAAQGYEEFFAFASHSAARLSEELL